MSFEIVLNWDEYPYLKDNTEFEGCEHPDNKHHKCNKKYCPITLLNKINKVI